MAANLAFSASDVRHLPLEESVALAVILAVAAVSPNFAAQALREVVVGVVTTEEDGRLGRLESSGGLCALQELLLASLVLLLLDLSDADALHRSLKLGAFRVSGDLGLLLEVHIFEVVDLVDEVLDLQELLLLLLWLHESLGTAHFLAEFRTFVRVLGILLLELVEAAFGEDDLSFFDQLAVLQLHAVVGELLLWCDGNLGDSLREGDVQLVVVPCEQAVAFRVACCNVVVSLTNGFDWSELLGIGANIRRLLLPCLGGAQVSLAHWHEGVADAAVLVDRRECVGSDARLALKLECLRFDLVSSDFG